MGIMQNTTVRKVVVGTGVAAVWIGGFLICYGIGKVTGDLVGKGATILTEKLLTKI